jgi:flagellar hook-length control protein FliK
VLLRGVKQTGEANRGSSPVLAQDETVESTTLAKAGVVDAVEPEVEKAPGTSAEPAVTEKEPGKSPAKAALPPLVIEEVEQPTKAALPPVTMDEAEHLAKAGALQRESAKPDVLRTNGPEQVVASHVRNEGTAAPATTPARADGLASTATPEGGAETAPRPSTLQSLPENMVRSVRLLVAKGEQTLTVRMVPESLGEVRLEVRTHADGVSIRIASASPAVRQALEQQMPALREALLREGIELGRIEVGSSSHASANSGGTGGHPTGQHGAGRPSEGLMNSTPSHSGGTGNGNHGGENPGSGHARQHAPHDGGYRGFAGTHGPRESRLPMHQGSMNLLV